jgi:hypothetical protein
MVEVIPNDSLVIALRLRTTDPPDGSTPVFFTAASISKIPVP